MRLELRATLAAAAVLPLLALAAGESPSAGGSAAAGAWQRYAAQSHAALAALNRPEPTALPPPPAGVTDIGFSEFFGPIGDGGLEYSPKLRALHGRVVRLVGYMVRVQERAPGLFLFAGWPTRVETKGVCMFDNTPPSAVHVLLPTAGDRLVPYRPGRIVLVGRIEIGPRPEVDGRNSTVRLVLDAESAAAFAPAAARPAG